MCFYGFTDCNNFDYICLYIHIRHTQAQLCQNTLAYLDDEKKFYDHNIRCQCYKNTFSFVTNKLEQQSFHMPFQPSLIFVGMSKRLSQRRAQDRCTHGQALALMPERLYRDKRSSLFGLFKVMKKKVFWPRLQKDFHHVSQR